ncbi:kynurenine formamidase [Brucella pseudogrignonensis]|uniref:Kynurenine formamidase n=1 Tax=Brucella pseudogrignonensis TaxID=419475 RepID=A0ABU1MBG8_9HYPH|nr:kynurenine formamidase [Brucella pseudogrignonensis]
MIQQLHRADFLNDANNIALVGGPRMGERHNATAIGVQAIELYHILETGSGSFRFKNSSVQEAERAKKKQNLIVIENLNNTSKVHCFANAIKDCT